MFSLDTEMFCPKTVDKSIIMKSRRKKMNTVPKLFKILFHTFEKNHCYRWYRSNLRGKIVDAKVELDTRKGEVLS
jgi:hypothetical protein